ncbi:hypothetical protein ACRWTT_18395 [Escherichia coli]|uniref:hypothetical protein n=1 Tax=Escherichia coli TaxID=562 RepID=UPI001C133B99|nr:hypothetical protein [Escherichia coli]EKG7234913.1 hypothetical protein [Escherichia coli]EKM0752988.1 hypothetical protein [Escherichia coli]ELW7795831.1 hypothetical protein [Escherichia coli]MDY9474608.1 hypothetical protein [Escherichia coli]HBC0674291.1 hypothetical protein [Escherichia coli]
MENQGCFVCAREGASMAGAKKCPLSGGQNNDLRHIILITGHSSMPIFNLAIFHFVHNIVIYHIHE